ncbi:MAG: DUF2723 domain-containing protein [Bacteroidales bacterium]|nr:DUF2723 domain-containing protein [Bacteroidales bacterium]
MYQKINNISGWIIFAIASTVYIITSEPTASFWDCGEYIATAYKFQVGHPPGAPFFQILGRIFTLFAFGDTSLVARMINTMSALSSGFTVLFLFWSITMLARKILNSSGEITDAKMYAVLGSGVVGALAYTFSDSFWFSATEGEVYAMSSFFSALVFWAILKWEIVADEKHSYRWLIFIAYMIGLSIGVHLLSLLAIPAITFVYYFRKYKDPKPKNIILVAIISLVILVIVQNGIIPLIVNLSGKFELLFVNKIGLPFNSGTIIYFILLIGAIIWGLKYTYRKQKVILNTLILAFVFILIGYSSFFLLVIRSNANPPFDENNPDEAISLLAYLNREQYGDWPIMYGNYYNAPVVGREDGNPVYTKSKEDGEYIVTDARKDVIPVYDPDFMTIFPRMWSNSQGQHEIDYKMWGKVVGTPVSVPSGDGEMEIINKPTFTENLRYFFRYQIGHMYFRYLMWNFAGRQNDIQGRNESPMEGNWISGIKFLDEWRLGPQDMLPEAMANSKARNIFYLLPFILGLAGLFFHFKKNYKDAVVIAMLFFMTGIAIVIFLNQYSPQPRERDYAYAASFYAFAIWIGLGTLFLFDKLSKVLSGKISAIIITLVCLFLVPGIMAKEGWDDHDRSGRYTALAMANNYLNSCPPNAILFTNGDNDTFPLWYAQEVEGLRTDVRVVNLSLLNTGWYVDQMKRKAYDSEPVPFSLPQKLYRDGSLGYVYFIERENVKGYVDLKELFSLLKNDPERLKLNTRMGPIDYFPTKSFSISVDSAKVVDNGTVPVELAGEILPEITWKLNKNGVGKNHLMVLDLLANNNWERPICFAITTGNDSYVGLMDYFQLEGLVYRLVPIKTKVNQYQIARINPSIMYDNLMNKFEFGNMKDPDVYLDETNMRMTMNLRNNFARLAFALIEEGKKDSAIQVCDKCFEEMPDKIVPFTYFILPLAEAYYQAGAIEKGNEVMNRLIEIYKENLIYYFSFTGDNAEKIDIEKQRSLGLMQRISEIAKEHEQHDISNEAMEIFNTYYSLYTSTYSG